MDLQLFEVGELVTWRRDREADLQIIGALRHGTGPFRIIDITDLRTSACDCDQPGGQHEDACSTQWIRNTTHPQHVTIETPKGQDTFSGVFLTSITHSAR